MSWGKKSPDGMFADARSGKGFLLEAGVPEAEVLPVAEKALEALLSRKRLSAAVGYPSPRNRYYSVESVSGSQERKLLGIGLSQGLAFLDAFGREILESGISPAELNVVLDLSDKPRKENRMNVYRKALESFAARNGLGFEVEPYDEYSSLFPEKGEKLRWVSAVVFGSGSGSVARDCGPTAEDACRRLAEVLAWQSGISLAEFLVREDVSGN